ARTLVVKITRTRSAEPVVRAVEPLPMAPAGTPVAGVQAPSIHMPAVPAPSLPVPDAHVPGMTMTGTAAPSAFPAGAAPLATNYRSEANLRQSAQSGDSLLIAFDTGQREYVPIPIAVNMGRQPSKTEPED